MNNLPILISFSGGRTSAFMTKYILESEKYKDREKVVIFSNTGKERTETLDFVNKCDIEWGLNVNWVEADIQHIDNVGTLPKKVTYQTASKDGYPFEQMIKKYGLPNKAFPHCTRELKQVPINKYMKQLGFAKYETAIGIRADEEHRINWERAKKESYIYPLATDMRVDKAFIRKWWDKQCFDLELKDYEGNCDMCWKKSERKLLTMILESPHLIEWWNEMEIKYGKDEFVFFRNNKSAIDLIELSKGKFRKVSDEHEGNIQKSMFDYELDIEYDCFCKSS